MKEFKGTKGRWFVDRKARRRVTDGKVTIASCSAGQSGDNLEEEEANAVAIAALPDLLKSNFNLMRALIAYAGTNELAEIKEAQEAINKALDV